MCEIRAKEARSLYFIADLSRLVHAQHVYVTRHYLVSTESEGFDLSIFSTNSDVNTILSQLGCSTTCYDST